MKYQFYLCENPKGPEEDAFSEQYILHAKSPRFTARILAFQEDIDVATAEYAGPNITFYYINADGIREIFTLVAEEIYDQSDASVIDSKLKRMADWYTDYLMWEDRQNIGKAGKRDNLSDYNASTPDLKILHNGQKWCIIYRGIIKVFDIETEMDEYLLTKLNFTDKQLEEGVINKF